MIRLPKQKIFEILQDQSFVCTFSGHSRQRRFEGANIIRAVLKTISLDDKPHYQLNTFSETQHFTRNSEQTKNSLDELLDAVLHEQFMQVHIQTPDFDQYYRVTAQNLSSKKTAPSKTDWQKLAEHDERRNYSLTMENSADLLRVLGIINDKGQFIAAMQPKYRQLNHFIGIASALDVMKKEKLHIVDCGCGKAYLSFALYHFLVNVQGKEVHLTGIDSNQTLINFCQQSALKLGYAHMNFISTTIAEAVIEGDIDMLIALHACDTATDDALALGLKHNATALLAAPCCHHFVNEKLKVSNAPELLVPLLRDGITRERFSDLLTDTMRRDILRALGYSAELIEFVAQEHTMKNIMIRAEHRSIPISQSEDILVQLRATRDQWKAAPKLAELTGL